MANPAGTVGSRVRAIVRQNGRMDESVYQPLVTLTRVGDLNSAHLLAARLQAEGVAARVRGEPLGPYPVTVGRMAVTEILVPADVFDDATKLLAELAAATGSTVDVELEDNDAAVESTGAEESDADTSLVWWFVAVILVVVLISVRFSAYL